MNLGEDYLDVVSCGIIQYLRCKPVEEGPLLYKFDFVTNFRNFLNQMGY